MRSRSTRYCQYFIATIAFTLSVLSTGCQQWPPAGIQTEPKTVEIGLLCRKQYNPDPYADRIYRHIDTMLQDQSLIGFNNNHERPGAWFYPIICTWKGVIGRTDWMQEKRIRYVDIPEAKAFVRDGQSMPIITDWYHFRVSQAQADALDCEWKKMEANVPHFRLFGRNCATIAANALIRAGILRPSFTGIRGIDRPENLLKMIYEQYPDTVLERGYFGYVDGKPAIELLQNKDSLPTIQPSQANTTVTNQEQPQTSEVENNGRIQTSEIPKNSAVAPASEAESESTTAMTVKEDAPPAESISQ